jgi:hypothetical protein
LLLSMLEAVNSSAQAGSPHSSLNFRTKLTHTEEGAVD